MSTTKNESANVESNLRRLEEEQQKGLQICENKIKQWKKFKEDYEALKTKLETISDKVSYDVMVPFGKLAFMPGRLVHTNEVTVLLGDNWFVERSAKQAADIVERRVKECDRMLVDLEKEQDQFRNWREYTDQIRKEVGGEDGTMEIVEQYNEQQEIKWRERHRDMVRKYKQEVAQRGTEEDGRREDEELWLRLDELELQEAELHVTSDGKGLITPDEKVRTEFKEQDLFEEEEVSPAVDVAANKQQDGDMSSGRLRPSKLQNDDVKTAARWTDVTPHVTQLGEPTSPKDGSSKHVHWKDVVEDEEPEEGGAGSPVRIRFMHSVQYAKSPPKTKSNQMCGEGSTPDILSPSDIYTHFAGQLHQEPAPKPILVKAKPEVPDAAHTPKIVRQNSGSSLRKNENFPSVKAKNVMFDEEDSGDKKSTAFSGKVIERQGETPDQTQDGSSNQHRPVSRFQSQRKNMRRN